MIDLFAGIGGIRRAFEEHGGRCIFGSEWDQFANRTYRANNPDDGHELTGDIRNARSEVPAHEVLLAGFPCQPFSLAGVSKKNSLGRPHGFDDPTQGTLFHEIQEILKERKPKAFLLENVKHLKSHDGGRTFGVIRDVLKHQLGYEVHHNVLDGCHWVPQHRERTIIVGFREPTTFDWKDLTIPEPDQSSTLREKVLHKTDGTEPLIPHDVGKDGKQRFFDHKRARVLPRYTISKALYDYLKEYREKHRLAGNGFGFSKVSPDALKTRTLSARYHKDGSEILIGQIKTRPRRLTPRECARLMGFPDDFIIPVDVSDTQAYRQFGNSVVVPAIAEVARIMKPHLAEGSGISKAA